MDIKVLKPILGANDQRAQENRSLLEKNRIVAINFTASPGAGKTSLLLATIKALRDEFRIGVVEGDVSSAIDAETVAKEGIPVVQINTGGACHLDATMISNALESLPTEDLDVLLIENVGNLICPASFALGEHRNVLVASVPEGHDKPYKYPVMFSKSDAVVLNKIDLKPYIDFDQDKFTAAVQGLREKALIFPVSCKTGEGIDHWASWLRDQIRVEQSN
ncbi:MAG TPA: hydrogenase accessory protein HypB [Candidatus Acetothermia bacterium]|nr:hydrogenase accessory protein HypB [Candidatus Acetothermia bacterium]